MVDLHAHTTASDGSLTPSELVGLARRTGLQALAVTDHDTVDGLAEALEAGGHAGIQLVPGVELAVEYPRGRFHMLGHFIQRDSQSLNMRLTALKVNRARRNDLMLERIQALGLPLTMQDIEAESGGGVVARPHMAKALVRKGIVGSVREAFDRYLGDGAPAHVPKDKIAVEEGIQLIHAAGGVASVAHPITLGLELEEFLPEFRRFKAMGLDGVECYYSQFTAAQSGFFVSAARDAGLVQTGGSDFHGDSRPDVRLGDVMEGRPAPYELLERLNEARARRLGDHRV